MEIREAQQLAWQNKSAKGFSVDLDDEIEQKIAKNTRRQVRPRQQRRPVPGV